MREFKIAVIPGDGIGKEVMEEALKVLNVIVQKYEHKFKIDKLLVGKDAYKAYGTYFPDETIKRCNQADAILFGATGVSSKRGRELILDIRKEFGFFANIRPVVGVMPYALTSCDFVIIRELSSGIYFGKRREADYKDLTEDIVAEDTAVTSVKEIERIARVGFGIARKRKKQLVSVDKANVLATSRLWRKVVDDVAKEYREVSYTHMFVDNAAMQLIKNPEQFDVILTDNMFGDILSDEAAGLVGSLGMLPSASLNEQNFGLFEPVHGSAPDIEGKGIANPIGMIRSAAMMLELSFGLKKEAQIIEQAIAKLLKAGYGTPDIHPGHVVGTREFGDLVVKFMNIEY